MGILWWSCFGGIFIFRTGFVKELPFFCYIYWFFGSAFPENSVVSAKKAALWSCLSVLGVLLLAFFREFLADLGFYSVFEGKC